MRMNTLFRRRSIRKNLWLLLLIQGLILLLWFISLWAVQSRNTLRETIARSEEAAMELNRLFEADIAEMQKATAFPIARDTNGLPTEIYKAFSRNPDMRVLSYEVSRDFDAQASGVFLYSPEVTRIVIANRAGAGFIYDRDALWRNSTLVTLNMGQTWISDILAGMGRPSHAMRLSDEQLGYQNADGYVYCARAIVNAERYEAVGIALVGMKLSKWTQAIESRALYEEQQYALLANGEVIAGGLPAFAVNWTEQAEGIRTERVRMAGETWRVTSSAMASGGLSFLLWTPEAAMRKVDQGFVIPLYALILSLVVSTIIVSGATVSAIQKPLDEMVEVVKAYGEGHLDARVHMDAGSELAALEDSINEMAERIEYLIDEVYLRELEQKETKLRLLRSQINPHFLYNALESARMRAYLRGDAQLEEMLRSLGEVLRYGLGLSDELVPLSMEVENVEAYLRVCNACAQRRIEMETQTQAVGQGALVPRMILQPLVENSIQHGFQRGARSGTVRLLGWTEGEQTVLRVTDDGQGVNAARLEELRARLAQDSGEGYAYSGKNIGLYNVHRRIQLRFGTPYGLSLFASPNRGFSVEIRLPLLREGEV